MSYKKILGIAIVAFFTIGVTACSFSRKQDLDSIVGQLQKKLPLQFGHGLQMSNIGFVDKRLCITVDCDTLNCLLPDSVLCTESFNMWLLGADVDFFQILADEQISVCITYKRGGDGLEATLNTSQIVKICSGLQHGMYKPMSLLELTSHEFCLLKKQLPRMESETLCLYDVFIKGKEITFIYIYPEEVTKESLALSSKELDEMKAEHSDGLRQSYSISDLEALKDEGAVFVYKYVTPNEVLCTIKIPADDIDGQSISF